MKNSDFKHLVDIEDLREVCEELYAENKKIKKELRTSKHKLNILDTIMIKERMFERFEY